MSDLIGTSPIDPWLSAAVTIFALVLIVHAIRDGRKKP